MSAQFKVGDFVRSLDCKSNTGNPKYFGQVGVVVYVECSPQDDYSSIYDDIYGVKFESGQDELLGDEIERFVVPELIPPLLRK